MSKHVTSLAKMDCLFTSLSFVFCFSHFDSKTNAAQQTEPKADLHFGVCYRLPTDCYRVNGVICTGNWHCFCIIVCKTQKNKKNTYKFTLKSFLLSALHTWLHPRITPLVNWRVLFEFLRFFKIKILLPGSSLGSSISC